MQSLTYLLAVIQVLTQAAYFLVTFFFIKQPLGEISGGPSPWANHLTLCNDFISFIFLEDEQEKLLPSAWGQKYV